MDGGRVLATLGVILLATAVIPPAAAWVVNDRRLRRAEGDLTVISERLRRADAPLRRLAGAVDVLCGPGRVPVAAPGAGPWATAPRGALAAVFTSSESVPIDPWGNCYLVNLAALAASEPTTVWVLSAGPNGIVETSFAARGSAIAGNDLGMRIR
jgi:hypothetical protein